MTAPRMGDRNVQLVEVGLRDGLQNEPTPVGTAEKLSMLEKLLAAGVRRFEVASFVHPKRVPQMADAEALVAALPDRADVSYIGLVLNQRGLDRALASREGGRRGIDEIGCVVVASDTFSRRNQGQEIDEAIASTRAIVRRARSAGLKSTVMISAAFGCPFEGLVAPGWVLALAEELAADSPDEMALADTIGAAVPAQVEDLFAAVRARVPHIPWRAHFHDTRNTGIANCWAAIRAGVRRIDASVGGLGGCPFAPAATGNTASEDVLYLLHRSGFATGVNLEAMIAATRHMEQIVGHSLPASLARAGDFRPRPTRESESRAMASRARTD